MEILKTVFEWLPPGSLPNVSRTCKKFALFLRSKEFWIEKFMTVLPRIYEALVGEYDFHIPVSRALYCSINNKYIPKLNDAQQLKVTFDFIQSKRNINDEFITHSCWILRKLLYRKRDEKFKEKATVLLEAETNQSLLAEFGAITWSTTLLELCKDREVVIPEVLAVIHNLALLRDNCISMGKCGTFDLLAYIMECYPRNMVIQRCSIGTLCSLARIDDNQNIFFTNTRILPLMFLAMKTYTASKELEFRAIICFSYLLTGNRERAIILQSFDPIIREVLEIYNDDDSLQKTGMNLLSIISESTKFVFRTIPPWPFHSR